MSYDLHLLRPRPGESVEETATRDADEDSPASPPDPQKEELKRRVAAALISQDKALAIFRFDYKEIARLQKISVADAQLRFRHIELNDDATGIQITLLDDEAGVTVPYWHTGEKAQAVLRRLLAHADTICKETGFVAYDPQLGRVVTSADLDAVAAVYVAQVHALRDRYPSAAKSKRPWWKFW